MDQLTIVATAVVLLGAVNVWLIGRVLYLEKRTRHLYKTTQIIVDALADATRVLKFLLREGK